MFQSQRIFSKIEMIKMISLHKPFQMFSETMTRAFNDTMAEFTCKMLQDAVDRLATKYMFDVEEAKELLGIESPSQDLPQHQMQDTLSGVVGKLPASPANDLSGVVGGNPLLSEYWKNTAAFTTIQEKETQIKHYKRMNASSEVLQLVELESKPFGSVCEKIISELFELGPRTSSQNDATLNGKKIEIKTARYWAGKDDCVWQHLEPDHDYDYALFVLLNFQGWKVWCIKKTDLMDLREKKIVTFQGKQGWWTRKSTILPHLTPIHTLADLHAFVQ
jgi:hypothetical protein